MKSGTREVGIREAKATLSQILRRVKRGEAVTITERGARIARIVPVLSQERSVGELVEQLEADGLLTRGEGSPRNLPRPIKLRGRSASAMLRSDRDDE